MADTDRPPPLEAFVSYAHEDEEFLDHIRRHLTLLVRQGVLSVWHDGQIVPGDDLHEEIAAHLASARLHLLLISADFVASDYIWGVEMAHALERHQAGTARVVPIIVRPCLWDQAPFAGIEVLPPDGVPISTWENRDEAYLAVAAGIRRAAVELTGSVPPADPA